MAVESLQAIVVLGALILPDGSASPALERRVEYGVQLWQQNQSAKLIMTGGQTSAAPYAESFAMATLAQGLGVPASAIIEEDRSQNTIENVANTIPILQNLGLTQVGVVTDYYHAPRAKYVFWRQGWDVKVFALWPAPWNRDAIYPAIREIFALGWTVLRVEWGHWGPKFGF